VHTIVGFKVRREYPEIKQTANRVVLSLFLFLQITLLQNASVAFLLSVIPYLHFTLTKEIIQSVVIAGVVLNIVATSSFEATYLVNKWKTSLIETEEFKKAYLQSELDNLKNQVNPHFLFNSINSLSSLISEDTAKAEKFLSEMSKVYRYLLQNNEQELTPLRVELEFITSYYHMLKTRYEDGIFMDVYIDAKYHRYLIPPLTLQMLIENAVKHNVILDKSPLYIKLIIDDNKEHLKVQNNIQKKTTAVESNKIGLKNIKAKYRLLNQDEVTVEEKDNLFTVTIPLVKTNEL
jgi:two-component system, LytTR family, sensor kinase